MLKTDMNWTVTQTKHEQKRQCKIGDMRQDEHRYAQQESADRAEVLQSLACTVRSTCMTKCLLQHQ